jgi:hypothetical protein
MQQVDRHTGILSHLFCRTMIDSSPMTQGGGKLLYMLVGLLVAFWLRFVVSIVDFYDALFLLALFLLALLGMHCRARPEQGAHKNFKEEEGQSSDEGRKHDVLNRNIIIDHCRP